MLVTLRDQRVKRHPAFKLRCRALHRVMYQIVQSVRLSIS